MNSTHALRVAGVTLLLALAALAISPATVRAAVAAPPTASAPAARVAAPVAASASAPPPKANAGSGGHAAMFRQFKEAILGKEPPAMGADQGIVLMQMIEALYRSAESGKSVEVKTSINAE